ncbi:hypothetical protein D9M71_328590 [compost metagenome]
MFQYTGDGDAAADEDRIRLLQTGQRFGSVTGDQLQLGNAERVAVVRDQLLAAFVGFDGDRPAARVAAQPFDGDRAAAGADVPQQLAGTRCQARQGDGAHVAFGQLSVVAVGVVGQATGQRQRLGAGICPAFHRQQIEGGGFRQAPAFGQAIDAPLQRSAEVFQHAQAAGAEATLAQQGGDGGGAGAVVAQDQQALAVVQVQVERRQRPRHHRQHGQVLQRPAQARGSQGAGGGRR